MNLKHTQNKEYRSALSKNEVLIRLEIFGGSPLSYDSIGVRYWNRQLDQPGVGCLKKMKLVSRYGQVYVYETVVNTQYVTSYIKYVFEFQKQEEKYYYDYYYFSKKLNTEYAFEYMYTNQNDILEHSSWLKDSVFYQIFPERFSNGDPSNDPHGLVDWESKPTRTNYMGGDLKGIENHLDYLENIGITAIYMNPIFHGMSNHKYDTIDYFNIDPQFGSNDDFKRLVEKCHGKGIKVILDGVFNHCGSEFPKFISAIQDKNSQYKDWFLLDSFKDFHAIDVDYECVGYYKYMPKFNYSSNEVRQYIIRIGKYWIDEFDIDGWRLDVADEVDFTFWYEFRRAIQESKKDAVMIAETWSEKKDMIYLNQMDSLMNYLFRDAITDFIGKDKLSTKEFEGRLSRIIGTYPEPFVNQMYNLIGCHDTERFLTLASGEKGKLKLAIAMMYLYNGIPALYYGDEMLMEGDNDPGCRAGMRWPQENLTGYIKKLGEIRAANQEIKTGNYKAVYCNNEEQCLGFVRGNDKAGIYVVLNNSNQSKQINLPLIHYSKGTMLELIEGKKEYQVKPISNQENQYNADIYTYKGSINISMDPFDVKVFKIHYVLA